MDAGVETLLSELLTRAQAGDRLAYEAFLVQAAELVRVFVRRHARGGESLEDVIQDTLLAIHQYRHTYDPARPARPWILAIAKHRLIDAVRKQRRRSATEVQEEATTAELHARESPAAPCSAGLLAQAWAALSKAQREIIELLKVEGYSVAEIARKTGRSEASVKVTAHRGYKVLRKVLEGAP